MVFGVSLKSRFLCIDMSFDEARFVVVRKVGDFFEIDFIEKIRMNEGLFEETRLRTPGKVRDVLQVIYKKYGALSVLVAVPEDFCYAALLPSETYASHRQVQDSMRARFTTQAYTWMNMFQKGTSSYMALHSVVKEVCDILYSLVKEVGFETIVMYPRALVLSELGATSDALVCDFGNTQTSVLSTYHAHTVSFSLVPYGTDVLKERIQKKFSLDAVEVEEVLMAYGTEVLPRKEGHLVHATVHTFLSPIIDELRSLTVRQSEYNLPLPKKLLITGTAARYEGLVEDFLKLGGIDVSSADVWEDVIDCNTYIPSIHKNESYEYAGIAGLMRILKRGTRYQPFDL